MKTTLYFICSCLFFILNTKQLLAQSNIVRIEYFIDNDPGYGLATNVVITPSTTIANLNIPINPTLLSVGMHTFIVRAKDALGAWSLLNAFVFYKPYTITSPSTANIVKLEYFIDDDPGYNLATNVTITSNTTISNLVIPINPNSLSVGIHSICLRAKDANGNWSLNNSTIFYKPYSVTSAAASNITKLEYFIDNDPGYGLATNVSMTSSLNIANLVLPINPTTLSTGIHTLSLRAKDANGNWSLQNTVVFYKPYTAPSSPALSNIVKVEYYFDYDPGYGNGKNIPITPATNLSNIVIPIDPFPLSVCEHTFNIRAKDANGNWSLLNEKPVIIDMTISVKLFIEGYYNGNGTMKYVLNNQGVQSGPCAEVDSVTVELRNATSPYAVAYSYKGVLRTDGVLPCKFPLSVNGNSYYIAIRHRNAIQTWSAAAVLMSQSTSYDFTTAANKAFGNNQIEIEPGIWAFYSGDLNADENIDLLDINLLEADVNNFLFGYYATDLNGDGNVDLLDSPIDESNINNFIFSNHP